MSFFDSVLLCITRIKAYESKKMKATKSITIVIAIEAKFISIAAGLFMQLYDI